MKKRLQKKYYDSVCRVIIENVPVTGTYADTIMGRLINLSSYGNYSITARSFQCNYSFAPAFCDRAKFNSTRHYVLWVNEDERVFISRA